MRSIFSVLILQALFLFFSVSQISAQAWVPPSWIPLSGPYGGTVFHEIKTQRPDYNQLTACRYGVWNRSNFGFDPSSSGMEEVTEVYRLTESADKTFWAATDKGIYRSIDGRAWTVSNFNRNPVPVKNMVYDAANDFIIIGTEEEGVWYLKPGTAEWKPVTTLPKNIKRITSIQRSDETVIASADTNVLFRYVNIESSFVSNALPFSHKDKHITFLTHLSRIQVAAVTDKGTVIVQNGTDWVERPVTPARGKELTTIALYAGNRNLLRVSDAEGFFYTSTDNGLTWSLSYALPSQVRPLNVLSANADSTVWGVTDFGFVIYKTAGDRWTTTSSGLYAVSVPALTLSEKNLWAAAEGLGASLNSDLPNTNWRGLNQGLTNFQIRAMENIGENTVFCGMTGGGLVLRSTATGLDWQVTGEEINAIGVQTFLKSTTEDTLWVGTLNAGIWFSKDRGDTWAIFDTLGLGSNNIQTLISVNNVLYAGTRGAGVRRKLRSNRFWEPLNDGLEGRQITAMVYNRVTDKIYCANTDGIYELNTSVRRWSLSYRLPFGTLVTGMVVNKRGVMLASTNNQAFLMLEENRKEWDQKRFNFLSESVVQKVRTLRINNNDEVFAGTEGIGVWFLDFSLTSRNDKNNNISSHFVLYPNPAEDHLTLALTEQVNSLKVNKFDYAVYDLTGKKLLTGSFGKGNHFEDKITLDVVNLSPGMYRLQITSLEGTAHIGFIKR